MKSTRIKRLKTLQHLARKMNGNIKFCYWKEDTEYRWWGEVRAGLNFVEAEATTFNAMLQALHTKARTEI